MMSRYYLHLRDYSGRLGQDEEGFEFPSLAAARDHALTDLQEVLAEAIKHGEEVDIEAIVVADERGRHLASVPVVAALPTVIVNSLKDSAKVVPLNRLEEYRRSADGCRSMAENAESPDDKRSWLNLADAWLQMLPKHEPATSADPSGWPKPSVEDSKASH
jgi:hypothetical protein